MKGCCIEWTFHSDRRFTQVTPYDEARMTSYYIAGGGQLSILLNRKIIKTAYTANLMSLILALSVVRGRMIKRHGRLALVPLRWELIDD